MTPGSLGRVEDPGGRGDGSGRRATSFARIPPERLPQCAGTRRSLAFRLLSLLPLCFQSDTRVKKRKKKKNSEGLYVQMVP